MNKDGPLNRLARECHEANQHWWLNAFPVLKDGDFP